jgi:DNA-binding CsgD family transcriptional regulator
VKESIIEQLPFYEDFVSMWKDMNKRIDEDLINLKYEETSKILGQYAKINNQFICIYNTKSQRILYLSDNYLDVLGYKCSEEDYKKYSALYWMRDLPLSQSWFMMQMTLFFKNTVQPMLKLAGENKSLKWYLHNFLLHPPKSEKHHISLLGNATDFTPNGSMLILMYIMKDVSSLINTKDSWWAEYIINGDTSYHFHHNEKKFLKGSILSNREKEILLLVKNGLDTKQISEKLFISTHTVDQHRKNMIERIGANNINTLIQICEFGNII